jgi:hypothetical protein
MFFCAAWSEIFRSRQEYFAPAFVVLPPLDTRRDSSLRPSDTGPHFFRGTAGGDSPVHGMRTPGVLRGGVPNDVRVGTGRSIDLAILLGN